MFAALFVAVCSVPQGGGGSFGVAPAWWVAQVTQVAVVAEAPPAEVVPAAGLPTLAERTLPKVVKIFGAGGFRGLPAYSTGCLVSAEGHIVTIWNHVLDTDRVTVLLDDGRRYSATLVGTDADLDLAVLKVEGRGLPYFDLEADGRVGAGDRVLCLSNMYKVATGDEPVSVQIGVVAAVTDLAARRGRTPIPLEGEALIVDAVTGVSGAGGGAVVNLRGELVGLLGREVKGTQTNAWLNYATPVSRLAPIVTRIVSGEFVVPEAEELPALAAGHPERLGILTVPNVVPRTPAFIEEVLAGSEASQAGLQPDDLIVSLDAELVPSLAALQERLAPLKDGTRVQLTVRRGQQLQTVLLRLAPAVDSGSPVDLPE